MPLVTVSTFDTYAVAEGVATGADIARLEADIARLEAKIDSVKWVIGFLTALVLAMAGRLFGVF